MAEYEKTARERLPQAAFKILPGVGHVPMIDDLDLVARTILAVTTAAKQQYRRDRISRTPLGSSRRRGRHLRSGRGTHMQPATGSTARDAMTATCG
jgi:hypothetical protein